MMLRIIFGVIIFVSVLTIVSAAVRVDIDVKPAFGIGEEARFDYTISSDEEQEITYFEIVECPDAPQPLLMPFIKTIGPNSPFSGTYTYGIISENIESQTCKAVVMITNPQEQGFEKTFIIETLPGIIFRVLTCKDLSCESESKTFLKNEDIYFSYVSDIFGVNNQATLTYPDKTTEQMTLPASIKGSQIGTYELEAIASKQGYKTVTKREQFAVIAKSADIRSVSVCNVDGRCSGEENNQNCPQDCELGEGAGVEEIGQVIIYLFIILIVFVLAFLIGYLIYKKLEK